MVVRIDVSCGELADKISILEIKSRNIPDATKLANITRELRSLREAWARIPPATDQQALDATLEALAAVNQRLWTIEDDIRDKERCKTFDHAFIELARSVYYTNDERARLKKKVDALLGSGFTEEKSYHEY
jgi:head-tail adaptor